MLGLVYVVVGSAWRCYLQGFVEQQRASPGVASNLQLLVLVRPSHESEGYEVSLGLGIVWMVEEDDL